VGLALHLLEPPDVLAVHDEEITYQPEALIQVLLDHAKQAFGVQSNHLLSLLTEGGTELNDSQTVEADGVVPGMLRASISRASLVLIAALIWLT
jgi:hypothetical protein